MYMSLRVNALVVMTLVGLLLIGCASPSSITSEPAGDPGYVNESLNTPDAGIESGTPGGTKMPEMVRTEVDVDIPPVDEGLDEIEKEVPETVQITPAEKKDEKDLTLEEGTLAVKIARSAVESQLGIEVSEVETLPAIFYEKKGVFVTLKMDGRIKGSTGYPLSEFTLIDALRNASCNTAFKDPRFRPLTAGELELVTFEVTILSTPVQLEGDPFEFPKMIIIGQDGVIVRSGTRIGVMLPQVAIQARLRPESMLVDASIKAGIAPEAWLKDGTQVYTFQARIFAEDSPKGEVRERNIIEELDR